MWYALTRPVTLALIAAALAVGAAAVAATPPVDPFLQSTAFTQPSGSAVGISDFVILDDAPRVAQQALPASREVGEIVLASDYCYDSYGSCTPSHYGRQSGCWTWQSMPDTLIWHSFLAGPREPRIGTKFMNVSGTAEHGQNLWDATVGGRRGVIRYGDNDPLRPQGWQLDIEGAALVRLNLDEERDVESSDFRFGVPLTYGSGDFQFKTGYYHLSSHLGDEYQVRNPTVDRINYVRDAIMLGVSYNPTPDWRLYGETAYAFFTAGGAEPWEFQFGVEYSQAGPTGFSGTPFFATNAHLRQELDFGGDWTTHMGWLWRNCTGNTMRLGLHYMNGKSTQYQFLNNFEEQAGVGLWYDY
ncbi:hypothetical protein Pla123a_34390 [Posidoniimonas polymericola]|uniref:DUF1207 domain-containing protein n=1 Tax=Posidoniimonas polymericola TaxID=2528002 RepID=A0A5C5YIB6_9BACT|nr:DUF1207 domain-containing protein [Posidoniimonas polymericola]TWT74615.1 hypothetical protein Pla123a_34390 [Posidoniimonas polymericola]